MILRQTIFYDKTVHSLNKTVIYKQYWVNKDEIIKVNYILLIRFQYICQRTKQTFVKLLYIDRIQLFMISLWKSWGKRSEQKSLWINYSSMCWWKMFSRCQKKYHWGQACMAWLLSDIDATPHQSRQTHVVLSEKHNQYHLIIWAQHTIGIRSIWKV